MTNTKTASTPPDSKDTLKTKISGIYKIVNKVNGKYYVGSSKNIPKRWSAHRLLLNKNIHDSRHLNDSWNKYGKNSFEFVVVKNCPVSHLLKEEQRFLDIAKEEKSMVYNSSFIAGKIEYTPAIRKKMSLARMGKYIGEKSPDYIKVSPTLTKMLKKVWIKLGKNNFLKRAKEKHNIGDAPAKRLIKLYRKDAKAVLLRKKFYRQKIKEIVGAFNRKRIGILHPLSDKKIYTFFNINSLEVFVGNKYDFVKKYSINLKDIHPLTTSKIKKTRAGWTIKI